MFRAVPVLVRAAGLALAAPSAAQSQAVNGAIEGTIVDASGGVLPGVAVTLTNTDTGAARTVVTNDQGLYRAPLLPLGTYRVTAELQGFKKFEQAGVPLATGQTAVVDIAHAVGDVTEVVTADSPIVDPGKIDLGRNMNEREIQTLPLTSALSVQGDDGRSDPTNLERDRGPNIMETRHTFAGSIVATPTFDTGNALLHALLNDNEVGVMIQLNSGLPFTVRSNLDLNQDGITGNDRPLDVGRNSMYLPARYNADLRYSRFIPVRGSMKGEVVPEFKNLFNNRQTAGVNRTVATNAAGNPIALIPASANDFPIAGRSGYEARQLKIGFKFDF